MPDFPGMGCKVGSAIIPHMILVTGGTGFIGQALIKQLALEGRQVRTLLRPSASSPRLPAGVPVEVAVCGLLDERGLRGAMKGVDVVFHLAGSERQGNRADLAGVDIAGTRVVAQVARDAGVRRLFFLSHLGADRASAYPLLKAKGIAENHVQLSGVKFTVIRSAVVFGPGDQFTSPLARLTRLSPIFVFLPGDGATILQPVWIDDLVTCLTIALDDPVSEDRIYTIGGAEYLSFRNVLEQIQQTLNLRRRLVPLTPAYVRLLSVFVEQFRFFPVSSFMIDYLSSDRTCPIDSMPRDFGVMPARFSQHLDFLASSR